MENNLNNANIDIKKEAENMSDGNGQDFVGSSQNIKVEVEDLVSESIQEAPERNNLGVVINICKNVQNDFEDPSNKEISACNKVKGQRSEKQVKSSMEPQSRTDDSDNTELLPVTQVLVDEKPNLNNNDEDKVKEELKEVNEGEESNNLGKVVRYRKRKSSLILIKKENFRHSDNSVVRKCRLKRTKLNKKNKCEGKSNVDTNMVNKLSKKNLLKNDIVGDLSITKSDENNLSDSDSKESDLEDFFDAVKPKKRNYRPRRRPQLSEEERAQKERQKLERRTCQICSAVFALPDGLRNHIRSKHTFEKPYSCKICGEQFSTRSSHSLHRRRHHGFQPFLCNLCGKTFLQKAHMEVHMRIHIPSKDKIRDVKCSMCPNVYTSKLNLNKHILTKHTDPTEWKHECNICRKKCFSTTDLTHHMRRHNDERTYKCVICGRGFFTKQTMNVHFRTHSASTAFNCEHCSKGYRSNEALQHHLLKVHGIGEEKPVSSPKHFCPVCNEGFRQRARLEKHLVIHETGQEEYPFKCEKCNKQYKARNYFTIHMLDKHKEFLDDSYFKAHFKLNSQENFAGIEVGNSDNS